MPYNRVQARRFLSAAETELFESSLGASRKALGTADLHRRLKRTRTLRDKSRDLLQRQKLATRARTGTKRGVTGHANQRTAEKAAALDEALKRFEAEAHARQALQRGATKGGTTRKTAAPARSPTKTRASVKTAPAPRRRRSAASVLSEALVKKHAADEARVAAAKPARSAKAPASPEETAPGGTRPTPPSVRARAVSSRLADSNLSHIQGHTSAQVRRSQARRDRKR